MSLVVHCMRFIAQAWREAMEGEDPALDPLKQQHLNTAKVPAPPLNIVILSLCAPLALRFVGLGKGRIE